MKKLVMFLGLSGCQQIVIDSNHEAFDSKERSVVDSLSYVCNDFQVNENYHRLVEVLNRIDREKSFSDESRAQVKLKALVVVNRYLSTHAKPEGEVVMNVSPPDGGPSGIAPSGVKDPEARAQYEKEILENNRLRELQNKYHNLSRLRAELANHCAIFGHAREGNAALLSQTIQLVCDSPKEVVEITKLINEARVNKNFAPSEKSVAPEAPPASTKP